MHPLLRIPHVVVATLLVLASPAQSVDAVFDSDGVEIRYVTEGTGEAIVVVHGWMGDSSTWGRDLRGETRLKAMPGFRAIAIDCRGHGQSGKPHEVGRYGVEMAADVLRLLDHLQIEKAHLIGYSSGAFIIGKVAAMRPDRVLSILYAGQAPLLLPKEPAAGKPAAAGASSSEVETFARFVEAGGDLGEYLLAITPPDRPKPTPAQASALAKVMYGGKDLKALVAAGRSFGQLAVAVDDLRKCQAPTLFLHGADESAAVRDAVAMARQRLGREERPHGELRLVAGGDHVTTLAKPEFAVAVREFLAAHRVSQDGR